ncbi:cytochrome c oxidase assembly factor CtaG, partial [Bacillus paranthracis]|nr:cytochrome c oxidase assembly factor CtaG [Bacillus paranthracis]
IFGFQAILRPIFLLCMLSILIGYFLSIGPYSVLFEHATKVSKKKVFYFTTGIVLMDFVKGGLIELIGHIIFSANMFEMAVMY